MTEQTLLRLAMVLQNQAPSTLNKYICNLAEATLLDYPDGINLFELSNSLNAQFNLAFTEEEIQAAINKRGQSRILVSGNLYKLSSAAQTKLALQPSLSEELEGIVQCFVTEFSLAASTESISSLLLRYLYYCFNSNVENLLSLFENRITSDHNAFEASTEDITIINDFITWNNPKKNALVYRLTATCYEYCMLTIKKDNILSTTLFKGKRFYLDANIIFRMAGINNEERKTVTQGFVDHCRRVGIELYCTSTTMDEVYRVISAQVDYIRGIAGASMPVSCDKLESINPHTEVNDFYRIYYNWCLSPENKYGDYTSFSQYLFGLAQDTLSQLKYKESSSFKIGASASKFSQQVEHLKNYKCSKRTWRNTSTVSAETDITNIMDTLTWRAGTGTTIWQTNDFIVSADQLLIGWSNNVYSGVPIVVLPSVWLSIILRFTGRTDDDYKSFCLFLTQRYHISNDEVINPIQLLKTINAKTTDTEIKEKIISEITQNKNQYTFATVEDYDTNTDRAFDKVLEEVYGNTQEQISQVRDEMQRKIAIIEQTSMAKIEETAAIHAAAERHKTLVALSKKQAAASVQVFRHIANWSWLIYLIASFIVLSILAIWIWDIPPMYAWLLSILPQKAISSTEVFLGVWVFISLGIGLLTTAVSRFISCMGSESREEKLYKRYYEKNKEALCEDEI